MIKSAVKGLLNGFGLEISRYRPVKFEHGIQQYQYLRRDGSFDYELYKYVQTQGNKRKIENTWVSEKNIAFLSDYIRSLIPHPSFGLCHGTRRGREQEWFREYLQCEVLGTEISDTAEQFPNTIQWDFHEVDPSWVDAVDFIYSNSFDHTYDPERCLNAWMSCIRKGGVCILEHTSAQEIADELDPFGAPIELMPYLVLSWGRGEFCVSQILESPTAHEDVSYSRFLVIQRTGLESRVNNLEVPAKRAVSL